MKSISFVSTIVILVLVAIGMPAFLPTNPVLAQQKPCDENAMKEIGGSNSWEKMMAQTFVASSHYKVTSIALMLSKNGPCSGTATITLRTTDSDGFPTDEILSSQTFDFAQVAPWNPDWLEINLTSPIALTKGVRYAIVVSVSTSNCLFWAIGIYIDYPAYMSNTSGWDELNERYTFRIYGDCNASAQASIGGDVFPVNKFMVMAPWLVPVSVFIIGVMFFTWRKIRI